MTTGSPRAEASAVVNAMTVDVEDYFHVSAFDGIIPRSQWAAMESRVVANTERLLRLFEDAGIRGTFFVLGCVAERAPGLVRTIAMHGHEVASHGYAHRLVYDLTPATFRDDVRRSKALLESECGTEVLGYRAPSYSITPRSLWALDILIEEGFRYDTSIFPIHHDRYGIPLSPRHAYRLNRQSGVVIEAPASTARWGPFNFPVAGGGYFRILPYGWTKWGIARINQQERRPAIFYIHPWEIDPGQPRLSAGLMSRFRHYRNLDRTEGRLRQLIADFRFGTMRALLAHLAADAAPSVVAQQPLPYHW
jgi:polysaccharide deacetylase family protein (PEP-CTERM system associated)